MEINTSFFIFNEVILTITLMNCVTALLIHRDKTLPLLLEAFLIAISIFNVINYSIFMLLAILGLNACILQIIAFPIMLIQYFIYYLSTTRRTKNGN